MESPGDNGNTSGTEETITRLVNKFGLDIETMKMQHLPYLQS